MRCHNRPTAHYHKPAVAYAIRIKDGSEIAVCMDCANDVNRFYSDSFVVAYMMFLIPPLELLI